MRWLSVHGAGWGIDPARLAVGGDSAGANLSFAAALRLRDRGEVGVVRAILSNYGYFTPEVSDRAEARFGGRSEEHTSELQSLMRISYAVFCLKKTNDKKLTH